MIKSALQSSLTNDIKYRSMSAGAVPSNEYLITTTVVGATPLSSVVFDFSGLSGTYRHLQVVAVTRSNNTNATVDYIRTWFNGVKVSNNYRSHFLAGNGSTVYSNYFGETDVLGLQPGTQSNTNTTGSFGALVIDILDPFSTTKNTTIKAFMGQTGSGNHVGLASGVYLNTAAATSFEIAPWFGTSWLTGSRFSLYGVTA